MIFRRLRQLSEAKVIKVIQKSIKNHLIFRSFTNQYAINHNISFIVIIYPHKVITTIKKTHYLCFQIIISIFLTFKPDATRANVVLKFMLDNNKKFRVIEEGVMNQGEMGVIKGGTCHEGYDLCKAGLVRYFADDPCPEYAKPCPNVEVYHICPGQNTYLNYCCPEILPE